jgi:hypothetical protein
MLHDQGMENSRQEPSGRPAEPAARCAHCHQPIYVVATDARWRGYCDVCARHLAGRPRHIESA